MFLTNYFFSCNPVRAIWKLKNPFPGDVGIETNGSLSTDWSQVTHMTISAIGLPAKQLLVSILALTNSIACKCCF